LSKLTASDAAEFAVAIGLDLKRGRKCLQTIVN
jgi:hypothetical protein